jgi:hypothetical protein
MLSDNMYQFFLFLKTSHTALKQVRTLGTLKFRPLHGVKFMPLFYVASLIDLIPCFLNGLKEAVGL